MAKLTVPILVDWEIIKDYMEMYDIVEVVRCKDCVHYGNDCVLLFPADGYCYDGERREDAD